MSVIKTSNLVKAANSYKLPNQLIECLIASGYESLTSVAAITELTTIEKFFRSTSHLFSPEEINRIYGRFANEPEKFCFLPGHQTQLTGFIEYCKRFKKECKGSVTLPTISPSEKTHKRSKQNSFKTRPVKIIKTEDRLAILAHEALSPHSTTGNLSESNSENDFTTILQSTDENELILPLVQADGQPCIIPSQEQAEFLAEVFRRLQNRIKNWCVTSFFEDIQRLKFRIDYDILIIPVYASASVEEKEKSLRMEEQFGCQVHVTCSLCSKAIRLPPQRGGFCTSNLFRHFITCRIKKSKKFINEPSMIQLLFRSVSERGNDDDVDLHNVTVEDEQEESANQSENEQKEASIEQVQEMIYVEGRMVEQDSDENKHLVHIAVLESEDCDEQEPTGE